MLSKRAQKLKPSPTLALAAKARELKESGKPVISLAVGEPDWPSMKVAVDAAIQALHNGRTKYTPAAGLLDVRKSIATTTQKETGVSFDPAEVVVGVGGKSLLFAAFQVLCEEGDEVIVPAPYWVSYPEMISLAEATPVIAKCNASTRFKLTGSILEKYITPKTKALVLNSPSNPTGEVHTKSELKSIAEVLKKHPKILVISDDIYNKLVFTPEGIAPHLLQVAPELKDRVIIVNGASKTFSMTGWRVGWSLSNKTIAQAIANYQSQNTSCAAEFSQVATKAAIENGSEELHKIQGMLQERRDFVFNKLSDDPILQFEKPEGAFYFWVNIEKCVHKKTKSGKTISNSSDFCTELLNEQFVACVPGIEFGVENYFRVSYVLSQEQIADAVKRIQTFARSLV